jgi:hypothetical protein
LLFGSGQDNAFRYRVGKNLVCRFSNGNLLSVQQPGVVKHLEMLATSAAVEILAMAPWPSCCDEDIKNLPCSGRLAEPERLLGQLWIAFEAKDRVCLGTVAERDA